ncbi:glycosyltransferase family 2 protein [Vibrio sp. PNB22_3_1]
MISIILPVYNGGKYLAIAIDSVLKQTFKDFELICINDGSTDNTYSILKQYEKLDSRVRVVSRENKGLIFTLNEGIILAKNNYIARMDADDICHPKRLELQYKYLEKHQGVAVVGSSYNIIDDKGNNIGFRNPPSYDYLIKAIQLFGSPFCHPAVMFNRKAIKSEDLFYSEEYPAAEDYELWLRLSSCYRFHNLKEKLLDYRILDSSVSRQLPIKQINSKNRAIKEHLFGTKKSIHTIEDFGNLKLNFIDSLKFILSQEKFKLTVFFVQVIYLLVKRSK